MSGGIIIKFGIVVVWRERSSSNASGPSHIYTQSYHKFGGETLLGRMKERGVRGGEVIIGRLSICHRGSIVC